MENFVQMFSDVVGASVQIIFIVLKALITIFGVIAVGYLFAHIAMKIIDNSVRYNKNRRSKMKGPFKLVKRVLNQTVRMCAFYMTFELRNDNDCTMGHTYRTYNLESHQNKIKIANYMLGEDLVKDFYVEGVDLYEGDWEATKMYYEIRSVIDYENEWIANNIVNGQSNDVKNFGIWSNRFIVHNNIKIPETKSIRTVGIPIFIIHIRDHLSDKEDTRILKVAMRLCKRIPCLVYRDLPDRQSMTVYFKSFYKNRNCITYTEDDKLFWEFYNRAFNIEDGQSRRIICRRFSQEITNIVGSQDLGSGNLIYRNKPNKIIYATGYNEFYEIIHEMRTTEFPIDTIQFVYRCDECMLYYLKYDGSTVDTIAVADDKTIENLSDTDNSDVKVLINELLSYDCITSSVKTLNEIIDYAHSSVGSYIASGGGSASATNYSSRGDSAKNCNSAYNTSMIYQSYQSNE